MKYFYTVMDTPVGDIVLIADNKNLCSIYWPNQEPDKKKFHNLERKAHSKVLRTVVKQLYQYFEGKRVVFDLPIKMVGTTFQRKVWDALTSIKFGETASYRDIAKKVGNPKAARAVGAAIGKNPISIIIPCHRVIGSNGKLTGFAGGVVAKEFLLDLESRA